MKKILIPASGWIVAVAFAALWLGLRDAASSCDSQPDASQASSVREETEMSGQPPAVADDAASCPNPIVRALRDAQPRTGEDAVDRHDVLREFLADESSYVMENFPESRTLAAKFAESAQKLKDEAESRYGSSDRAVEWLAEERAFLKRKLEHDQNDGLGNRTLVSVRPAKGYFDTPDTAR